MTSRIMKCLMLSVENEKVCFHFTGVNQKKKKKICCLQFPAVYWGQIKMKKPSIMWANSWIALTIARIFDVAYKIYLGLVGILFVMETQLYLDDVTPKWAEFRSSVFKPLPYHLNFSFLFYKVGLTINWFKSLLGG